MGLDERFMAAVLKSMDEQASGADLLPMVLTQACVTSLQVAGAGLSITDNELRVPLGASDEMAARAESLQVTLGEGPCLDATSDADPVSAGEAEMDARWPMFYRELLARTPFRGVASIPLRSRHHRRFGALDLYVTDADDLERLSLDRVNIEIADLMASALFDAPREHQLDMQMPAWMSSPSVSHRMNVWVAVGLLIEHAGVSNSDALAALRAYAFGHDQTLDEVAERLISRRIRPHELVA